MKHIKLYEEFVNESLELDENFPGPGETVDAKDLDNDMLDYFNRTNKVLSIDTKSKKGIKGSVGKMYGDLVFNGDDIKLKDIVSVKILESSILFGDFLNEERIPTQLYQSEFRKYFSGHNYDVLRMQYDKDRMPDTAYADNGKYYEVSSAYKKNGERIIKLKLLKTPKNESAVTESTIQYFKPTVLDKKNAVDTKFFKKLMPRTAGTTEEAMERIWMFEDSTMFVHYQYHIVKPNGNKPDRPTYRLHQSQYWLTSAYNNQIKNLGLDPSDGVNTTLVTIFDITDPNNKVNLGQTWVDTRQFLDELNRVFEVLSRES